jgi:uncharacterized 2Fe-2S/4Fe-4S cluster protein (DUF4445 family)
LPDKSVKFSPNGSFPLKSSDQLAIAFDIGTTTLAASLVNCRTGERLGRRGALNPQREFGADVISRLQAACESAQILQKMTRMVNAELQRLALDLLGTAGAEPSQLRLMAMAGNPAMEHLLLGLPAESLVYPPFRPLFTAGRMINSAELGWDTATETFIFPLPGGFVGGDLVAFLFGIDSGGGPPLRSDASENISILQPATLCLDLGTNAEIALETGERIFATSAAAGPALEGGNLACGMAALPGAINRVKINGEKVSTTTIGNSRPVGICGSGVIEAVAELLDAGVVDNSGRLRAPQEIATNMANRVREIDGTLAFVLHQDARCRVYLSQQDIREVQLAKAALRAGMEILFRRAGITADDLQQVILTGSFGAELSAEALKKLGIFTGEMVHMTGFIREGVLAGAEKLLCSEQGSAEVTRLEQRIKVIPLSGTPAFEKLFFEQMNFPQVV